MMRQQEDFQYVETETYQAIQLPFKSKWNTFYTLYIFLPAARMTVAALSETLESLNWKEFVQSMRDQKVILSLPSFETECNMSFNDILKRMGVHDAFLPQSANFSGISDCPTYINQILQKIVFKVTEQGAEAAAVTAVCMDIGACPPIPEQKPKVMTVDRPFLYILMENLSDNILFVGKIENPQ